MLFYFNFNTFKLVIDWNSSGRLFHSLWPPKVNVRWPAAVLQSGICRRSLFIVLQLCTSDLVLNFSQRYGGESPFKHLNTMVASLTSSCLTIGSHCNCLRIVVTWSNFLVPETIRAPKFCTVRNSSMFFLVVLAHTNEQYNNLLNTRELIIVINVRLSNRYFTRFIWQRLPIHFEVHAMRKQFSLISTWSKSTLWSLKQTTSWLAKFSSFHDSETKLQSSLQRLFSTQVPAGGGLSKV